MPTETAMSVSCVPENGAVESVVVQATWLLLLYIAHAAKPLTVFTDTSFIAFAPNGLADIAAQATWLLLL